MHVYVPTHVYHGTCVVVTGHLSGVGSLHPSRVLRIKLRSFGLVYICVAIPNEQPRQPKGNYLKFNKYWQGGSGGGNRNRRGKSEISARVVRWRKRQRAESEAWGGRLGHHSAGRNRLRRHRLPPVHFAESAHPRHRPGPPTPQVSRAKHLYPGSVDIGQPQPQSSHPQHVRITDTQGIKLSN